MREASDHLQRIVLLHLLEHRGQQVRFEASHWATEIGILRRFPDEDPALLKSAIRTLEMTRMIYRRIQYVVGYSEPKHVFSLTPSGHRKALEFRLEAGGSSEPTTRDDPPPHIPEPDEAYGGRAPEPSA
ncbi:MAG TPA: hypothetical protein VML94_01280 [Thermoplasmata archaeon]|nr:hypothetical protein [Thermoplasmata archaeon]